MPVQTSDDESFFAERYLSNESLPAVEPDLLVIEAAAQAGEAGEGMVRNFHEHLVGELFGNRIGWLTAHAKDLDRRIEFQEAQLSRLEKQMDAESLECETKPDGPSVPWTWPEIFGLFLKGATVAVFAYLELNAIGIMGLAGEIPKVDTLPKAIKFFGAAAIALPWSVKLLGHFALGNEFQRHFYFILSWAAALLIVFWAFVMSEVFGGFLIISLDPDIPLFPKWILIAAQTIGCGLIAGLLSISMCHTFEKHRGFKVVPNPRRAFFAREVSKIIAAISVDRQRLGLAEGRLAQINHIRERVVKESLALFTLALRVSQFERRAVDTYNTKFFSPPTRLAGGRMRTSNQTKNGNGALKES